MLTRSQVQNKTKFTHFLNEKECYIAEKIAKNNNVMFCGGYDDATRKILGIFADYDEPDCSKFPFACLKFTYRKQDGISHRDILGSLMGLQIKRNSIGDIIVNEGFSYVFAENSVSTLVVSELSKVGRVGVKVSIEENPVINAEKKYLDINGTVSSMRADAIISLVTKFSRSKAQSLISSKGIILNYEEIHDVSKHMKTGDIFSVQGYGKFVIDSIGANTKSGRIHILVRKYQ